ncbi:MAG: D-alanine--D-alanine ligase [Candidatus Margulisbacteria bacterium]|nr:D-alanine--D-alanine ligase [Candidatus Margulisiibacteriota bacterium]
MAQKTMTLKSKKIGVLMGGPSREREISLRSGKNVLNSLKRQGFNAVEIIVDGNDQFLKKDLKEKKIEVAFVILHGAYGEDGQVQELLESINIPYTGSDPEASRITMNKLLTKQVLQKANLPTPEYQAIKAITEVSLAVPLVIKPVCEGSSFGVSIVKEKKYLIPQLEKTFQEFPDIFIEKFINGKEVTVGIIGTDKNIQALPILELVPHAEFYDYEAKYTPGKTSFILPAKLDDKTTKNVQNIALQAHLVTGCNGMSRVDFIIDEHNQPWITEINSIPGMTDQSDLPAEAKVAGISFDELVYKILESAHL